ncbi:hypothetical protein [Adlercreutzia sp. ZJ304]|uniref:hypothetical protein n=1 Tax=Adlercreutzia sp. ZJ304 TaxID=2709791 RepID=UPI0013E9E064|nr:hypothetical protein [Adlercreutzia sp. ZJ304]
MKKTTKIMSTLALSAVLAMGCAVPAFAEGTGGTDGGSTPNYGSKVGAGKTQLNNTSKNEEENAGTVTNGAGAAVTDINLRTTTDQINCMLPLEMTVAAKTLGGPIICPSAGTYAIQNNVETGSLYIIGMKAELQEGWTASNKNALPGENESISATETGHGAVYMQVTANSDTKALTENEQSFKEYTDMAWAVPAKGSLALDLKGHASAITGIATDEAAGVQLMKVTYTVSAMHPNNATILASEVTAE